MCQNAILEFSLILNFVMEGWALALLILALTALFVLFQIRDHPGYKSLPVGERNSARSAAKDVMVKSEKLKLVLKDRFEREHQEFLVREEEDRARREHEERIRKVRSIHKSL